MGSELHHAGFELGATGMRGHSAGCRVMPRTPPPAHICEIDLPDPMLAVIAIESAHSTSGYHYRLFEADSQAPSDADAWQHCRFFRVWTWPPSANSIHRALCANKTQVDPAAIDEWAARHGIDPAGDVARGRQLGAVRAMSDEQLAEAIRLLQREVRYRATGLPAPLQA